MSLPETINQKDLSELIGLTVRRLDSIAKDNGVNKVARGVYNFKAVIQAILKEKDKKSTPAVERLYAAKASREERKDKQESGDVITSAIFVKAHENIVVNFKQRMLRVGNNVQSKLGLSEPQRKAVDDEVREGLKELEKKLEYAAEAEDDEAAVERLESK